MAIPVKRIDRVHDFDFLIFCKIEKRIIGTVSSIFPFLLT